MSSQEYRWKTYDDLELHAWSVIPQKPTGVISLVHGIGEYSERYLHVAQFFNTHNFGFISFDLRGHGKSDGKRGLIRGYHDLMKDIELLILKTQEICPDIPNILYGHSMGGSMVLNYVLENPVLPHGLVVTSPWLKLGFDPPKMLLWFGNTMKNFFPGMVLKSPLETAAISRDPEVVKKYENDPLIHNRVSLELAFSSIEKGKSILQNGQNIRIPVLLMQGTEDRITSMEATKELAASNPSLFTFKEWEGFYHEVHNEPEKEEVLRYMLDWINNIK